MIRPTLRGAFYGCQSAQLRSRPSQPVMNQSSGAKPARSCSHSMHWTAANPRTEGVVSVLLTEDRCRPKTLKITEVHAHRTERPTPSSAGRKQVGIVQG